jgi:UDP-perosamine 4-acetyltransferase
MAHSFLILGAGGHARVLADLLLSQNQLIAGFLDPDTSLWGTGWRGIPIIGGDEKLAHYPAHTHDLINGVGSIGCPELRRTVFERYRKAGYKFPCLVHARATVAIDARPGEGSQIMAGAVIQTGCHIGINTVINTGAIVDHDCHIGDHVHIAPGAILSGGVRVGESTHVGTGATVIQGIKIGRNSLIAAGAVVIRDVPDGATVAGVPAKEGLNQK